MRGKPLEPPSTAHKQRITPAGAGKTPPFTEVCRHYDRITPAGAGKTTLKSIKTAQTKDHPRRCGENALGASAACRCAGSPPQVRGKLGDLTSNFIFSRITPAGAGKTFLCVVFHFVSHGSPPQVRACTRVSICYLIVGNLTCFKTTLFFQMGLQIFRYLITQHVQAIIICTLNG